MKVDQMDKVSKLMVEHKTEIDMFVT